MPVHHSLFCDSVAMLDTTAEQLIKLCGQEKIWLWEGNLGAGKTTLIKAVCQQLGVTTNMSSPTFGLVNEYEGTNGLIYHMDCYRLRNLREALDIGMVEYLLSGNYCFIEWADRIQELIEPPYWTVQITVSEQEQRIINLSKHE